MVQRYVYLAGSVMGKTTAEANNWRRLVASQLMMAGGPALIGISPLRCEPPHGDTYTAENPDPLFGTPAGIAAKNMFDVRNCDMVLAYMPVQWPHASYGTIVELAWARAFDKPAILVSDDPSIITHPVVKTCVDWIVDTLEDGVDIAVGILGGYCGGKSV